MTTDSMAAEPVGTLTLAFRMFIVSDGLLSRWWKQKTKTVLFTVRSIHNKVRDHTERVSQASSVSFRGREERKERATITSVTSGVYWSFTIKAGPLR